MAVKKQYTKDKTERITIRVNAVLGNYITNRSNKLGVAKNEYVRSVLFQQMSAEEMMKAIEQKPTAPKK